MLCLHKSQMVLRGMAGKPCQEAQLAILGDAPMTERSTSGASNNGCMYPGCTVGAVVGSVANSVSQNKDQDQEKA